MEADPEMEEIMEMRDEWSREQRRRVASALIHAAAFPGIRVDRARFLSEALKKQCPTRNVWEAVASTPQQAEFDAKRIEIQCGGRRTVLDFENRVRTDE